MKKSIAVIIFGIIFILVGFIISNEQKELIKELSAKQNKAEAVCVKSDFTKKKCEAQIRQIDKKELLQVENVLYIKDFLNGLIKTEQFEQ